LLGALITVGSLVVGVGLAFNCLRGLLSREGMYDSESTSIMFWSQLGGIALGVMLTAWSLGLFDLPMLPGGCGSG
jgi:hypothetical protein